MEEAPRFTPQLTNKQAIAQYRLLKAVADPVRLQILALLLAYGGNIAVEDIIKTLDIGKSLLQHHLRVLREAGAITYVKRGKYVYYQSCPKMLIKTYRAIYDLVPRVASASIKGE